MPSSNTQAHQRDGSPRVLLVDDNPDHLFLTRRELEKSLSCQVVTAQSGGEALRLAQTEDTTFDAILLDNLLPDMSGLEVLARLRESGILTPIVLVTGQGSEQVAVEALRSGASDYIVKSGGGGEIVSAVVQKVIERDKLRRRTEQLEAEHVRFARMAAVGEVAAGIAHEIRNPLTIISGMATLLRDNFDRLPPEDLRKCTNAIADNCIHLNRVLDEVLSSASTSGSRIPMLLAELVDETLAFMRFDHTFRYRMNVVRDFQSGGLVMANRDELKQIFINLFRNAAQSLEMADRHQGTLQVTIHETSNEDGTAENREVVACVTDDGPGIAPEAYNRLFETGFTTKNEQSGVKGSGLGLGICRRIAENHGGRLWATEPVPGQGATFCLALPLISHEG